MQKKDQIAELFKDTFENFEAPVRPELWNNIASQIQTPASPSGPDGSSVTQVATVASKISGSFIAWVGGAALVAVVGAGYYFNDNSKVNQVEKAVPVGVTENNSINTDLSEQTVISEDQVNTTQPITSNPGIATQKSNTHKKAEASSNQQTSGDQVSASNQDHNSGTQNSNQVNRHQDQPATSPNTSVPNHGSSTEATTGNSAPAVSPSTNTYIKAVITANPADGYAPLQVNFASSATNETNEWHFGDGSESAKGSQVQHTFNQSGSYLVTLKTTGENGITHTELVRVIVHSDLTISNIPNVFTPNGDGLNDQFSVKASEDVGIEVSIFDKSGRLVYKYSGSENSWNGKLNNNQEAEAGTYFYVIFATGQNGEKNTQRGTLTLKR